MCQKEFLLPSTNTGNHAPKSDSEGVPLPILRPEVAPLETQCPDGTLLSPLCAEVAPLSGIGALTPCSEEATLPTLHPETALLATLCLGGSKLQILCSMIAPLPSLCQEGVLLPTLGP